MLRSTLVWWLRGVIAGLAWAPVGMIALGAAASAGCDDQLLEYELRGKQRGWAFTAIEKAASDADRRCKYTARLAGIHAIRTGLAPALAGCEGAPRTIDADLAEEKTKLDELSAACPPFEEARCAALAAGVLDLIKSDLTPKIQNIALEREADENLRCDFVGALKSFLMNATADFSAIEAHCPKSFGAGVEAALLPVRIVTARRLLRAQEDKVRPWVPQCK